jgi:hypothetical protein
MNPWRVFITLQLYIKGAICAGLVAAAAHLGASLVYGPDFLKEF